MSYQLSALISSFWTFALAELCLRLALQRPINALNCSHYFSIFAFLHIFFFYNKKKLIYFICMRVINLNDLCSLQIYWQFHIKTQKKKMASRGKMFSANKVQTINAIVRTGGLQAGGEGWRAAGQFMLFILSTFHSFHISIYAQFTISNNSRKGSASHRIASHSRAQKQKAHKKEKNIYTASILWSPKAALQLKCIFAVYELNLINNFCIVAKSFLFVAISDCQQTV